MKYEEEEPSLDTTVTMLTETVAHLSLAVKAQNAVIMCLLKKLDLNADLNFTYMTKEQFEKEMGAKVEACEKTIRKIYGPSETDKS